MENSHKYFKRDISWLSFNYRVLLEAEDETLPIYERIKFLSIYSSNLEEFYEIRVAEHRGVIMKKNFTEESGAEAEETLAEITEEVNRQQREYYRIFSKVLQELNRQDIYLYQDSRPEPPRRSLRNPPTEWRRQLRRNPPPGRGRRYRDGGQARESGPKPWGRSWRRVYLTKV